MISLYPRHYLDISTSDLVRGASGFFNGANPRHEIDSLETAVGHGSLVTLSVRTAWDLLLTALDLPHGSEVIMSAVTIPDMARIVEAHGLVVVPVDLDPKTMAPRVDIFSRAFSDKTELAIIAHLLGGSFDIGPYADIADLHGVPLIEDRAQAFVGPHDWGSSRATASFFSFGSIKTCTALGGAISIVRNPLLLHRMQEIQSQWAFQSDQRFTAKATKYLGVQGFRSPIFYSAIANVASHSEGGLDGFIRRTVKGFPANSCDALLSHLRQRPSGAQVALLRKRIDGFDGRRLTLRAERGELLMRELSLVCDVPGQDQPQRTHWLFGVLIDDPPALIQSLRAAGFDATQGATTIGPLEGSEPGFSPTRIRKAMSRMVFLPSYPEMPSRVAARLVSAVFSFAILRPPRALHPEGLENVFQRYEPKKYSRVGAAHYR